MSRGRGLTSEERALWAQVMASVQPLHPAKPLQVIAVPPSTDIGPPAPKPPKGRVPPAAIAKPKSPARSQPETLDGSWDRRIARGSVTPESSIDLHGHTLASAHALLDRGLDRAIARGDRVLLLVTGKPPRADTERPHARGAIRAAVGDWIAASRHADRIAAVRPAHPRHGGSGALYIVLRRARADAARKS